FPDVGKATVAIAGVEVHLPAACLRIRELDVMAQAPQHRDRRLADVREQQVVEAGDEQRDSHRAGPAVRQPTSAPRRRVRGEAGSYRRRSWVARTSARSASRSPLTRPRARAWTRTLPTAVASTGPAMTGRPQASA